MQAKQKQSRFLKIALPASFDENFQEKSRQAQILVGKQILKEKVALVVSDLSLPAQARPAAAVGNLNVTEFGRGRRAEELRLSVHARGPQQRFAPSTVSPDSPDAAVDTAGKSSCQFRAAAFLWLGTPGHKSPGVLLSSLTQTSKAHRTVAFREAQPHPFPTPSLQPAR